MQGSELIIRPLYLHAFTIQDTTKEKRRGRKECNVFKIEDCTIYLFISGNLWFAAHLSQV